MKKILITGGAGFIGFNLLKKLSSNKNNLIDVYDNFFRGKKDIEFKKIIKRKNVNFYEVDLTQKFKLKKNYNEIYHFAAIVGVSNVNLNPLITLINNVKPLMTILEETNVKKLNPKIIFASTSEVYGPIFELNKNKLKFSEEIDLIFPSKIIDRHSYLMSKIYCEKLLELSGLKYIIVRPHNIYGPRMGFSHVIPELINKIKFEKKINVFSPYHSRAFCFIDDAIDQILKLNLQKKALNNTFNIGNDSQEIKIIELARKLIKLMKSKKNILKQKNSKGSPRRRCPNLNKIKKYIKLNKFSKLEDGLKKTIKWYSEYD